MGARCCTEFISIWPKKISCDCDRCNGTPSSPQRIIDRTRFADSSTTSGAQNQKAESSRQAGLLRRRPRDQETVEEPNRISSRSARIAADRASRMVTLSLRFRPLIGSPRPPAQIRAAGGGRDFVTALVLMPARMVREASNKILRGPRRGFEAERDRGITQRGKCAPETHGDVLTIGKRP